MLSAAQQTFGREDDADAGAFAERTLQTDPRAVLLGQRGERYREFIEKTRMAARSGSPILRYAWHKHMIR